MAGTFSFVFFSDANGKYRILELSDIPGLEVIHSSTRAAQEHARNFASAVSKYLRTVSDGRGEVHCRQQVGVGGI